MKQLSFICIVLMLFCAPIPAQEKNQGGIVRGARGGFNVSAPEGWVVDNESGVNRGEPCVLYPKGESLADARTRIYAKDTEFEDVEAFVAEAKQHGEKIASGKTADGRDYFINENASKTYSQWARTGYVQLPQTVAYIVLSSRDEASYRKDSGALEKVLKTLVYVEPKSGAARRQSYANHYSFLGSLHQDAQIEPLLTEWREKEPNDPEAWITSANYYFKEREMIAGSVSFEQNKADIKRAGDLLQEATTKFPDRLDIWCGLAFIYQESEDFDNELSTLKKMLAYAREHPAQLKWEGKSLSEPADQFVLEKLHSYGLYYYKKLNAEGDKRWFQIATLAMQQYPNHMQGFSDGGGYYADIREWRKAREMLEKPHKIDAESVIIRDKSPDGNFALRIHLPKELSIINLLTKERVLKLDCNCRGYEDNAKLVWFSDSQRVACYVPDDQGGYEQVFFRRGSSFEEVQLPSIPNLTFPRNGLPDERAITSISEPIRWLESGALVLHQEQERLVAGSAAQEVTIGFDKHGHGSVLKVEAKKVTQDALDKDSQLLVLPAETAYFQVIASDSINDLTVRVSDRGGKLHQGDNETSIEFRDAKGRLADVGKVNLQIDSKMPGTQVHRDVVVERTATRGLYRAKIQVDISGDWNMKISYDGPHGKGETTFLLPLIDTD